MTAKKLFIGEIDLHFFAAHSSAFSSKFEIDLFDRKINGGDYDCFIVIG